MQTLEGNPALVHGGPFANIAHGCNSVIATRAGLKLADYVVTEAGFGADLGAEKFFDIKCRKAGLTPAAASSSPPCAPSRFNGGVDKEALGAENLAALAAGLPNLERHIANMRKFGVPVIVAVNRFASDTPAELALIERDGRREVRRRDGRLRPLGARLARRARPRAAGRRARRSAARRVSLRSITTKRRCGTRSGRSRREIYGAVDIAADSAIRRQFQILQEAGYGALPVCIAKTQYSFSADPSLLGAPSGHVAPIRALRLRAGAGFLVVLLGDILTMPGLPRAPAAERISIRDGRVEGLF